MSLGGFLARERPLLADPAMAKSVLLGVCLLGFAIHLTVLPNGKWHHDDYALLSAFGEQGVAGLLSRLTTWSPRPVSEVLLFGYGQVVEWLGRPVVGLALLVAWVLSLAPVLVATRLTGISPLPPLLVVGSALFLSSPSQMWYWPAGAFAYVPSLGGVAACCILLLRPIAGPGRRAFAGGCLVVAAASSEVGAVAASCLAASNLAVVLWRRTRTQNPRALLADVATWGVPLVSGLAICAAMVVLRLGNPGEAFASTPMHGSPGRSSLAAMTHLPDLFIDPWPKLVIVAGLFCLLPAPIVPACQRPAVLLAAVALLVTCFATLVLAYFQFGTLCCTRHESLRDGLVTLAWFLAFAAGSPRRATRHLPLRVQAAGIWLLCAGLGATLLPRVPALLREHAQMSTTLEVRRQNWEAGRSAQPDFIYRIEPGGRITGHVGLAPGSWTVAASTQPGDEAGGFAHTLMTYFRKTAIEIRHP